MGAGGLRSCNSATCGGGADGEFKRKHNKKHLKSKPPRTMQTEIKFKEKQGEHFDTETQSMPSTFLATEQSRDNSQLSGMNQSFSGEQQLDATFAIPEEEPKKKKQAVAVVSKAELKLIKKGGFDVIDDKYFLVKSLGEGAQGQVKIGVDMKSRRKVAIKIFKKVDQRSQTDFFNEIEAMQRLKGCPQVPKLYDYGKTKIISKDGQTQDVLYFA